MKQKAVDSGIGVLNHDIALAVLHILQLKNHSSRNKIRHSQKMNAIYLVNIFPVSHCNIAENNIPSFKKKYEAILEDYKHERKSL